jgi:hypothetical protein
LASPISGRSLSAFFASSTSLVKNQSPLHDPRLNGPPAPLPRSRDTGSDFA